MWERFREAWEGLPWLVWLVAPLALAVALVALGVWSPIALLTFGVGALSGFLLGVGVALERPRAKMRPRTTRRRSARR